MLHLVAIMMVLLSVWAMAALLLVRVLDICVRSRLLRVLQVIHHIRGDMTVRSLLDAMGLLCLVDEA